MLPPQCTRPAAASPQTLRLSTRPKASRVPALRNLPLRAPPPQFRWHKQKYLYQNAQFFVNYPPLVSKRPAIDPHNHPIPPKNSSAGLPAPATLPPCSNPYPVRYHITQRHDPTRHPDARQPALCPLPNTANLPPNPLICPPIPLKPPPKPRHRPPFSPTARSMPYWD